MRTRRDLFKLRTNANPCCPKSISSQAFDFCLKYARKTEFRRLSDILRQHLSTAIKYAHQPFGIDLKDPETLQRHLATRFRQLSVASALELWQEAFKTTEDIQQLLSSSTIETPKPFMMANYFESLAQTFLVGENLLYHAAAWTKYYQIAQLNKNLSAKEQEALASQVLISALSAPPSRSASSADALSPKAAAAQARLNQLLRTDKSPSREELLKEAVRDIIFQLCMPSI